MAQIINGKILAKKIKKQVINELKQLGNQHTCSNRRPNLAIILIGERQDSMLYVELKEKEAKKFGIDMHTYKCPEDISEREILEIINHLNQDDLIDGILVQLPLPKGFDTDAIIRAIDPAKDVDRFHPDNLKILFSTCNHHSVIPPVFAVVLEMLKSINYDMQGKQVCIICNWDIFGKGLTRVMECQGCKADIANADDKNLNKKTRQADILISAVGKPGFIKKEMIKRDCVIIDIGIVKKGKKVYGDVDFKDCQDKAKYISPVPGGVGPLTIAMAFKNTLELYKRNNKNNKIKK